MHDGDGYLGHRSEVGGCDGYRDRRQGDVGHGQPPSGQPPTVWGAPWEAKRALTQPWGGEEGADAAVGRRGAVAEETVEEAQWLG